MQNQQQQQDETTAAIISEVASLTKRSSTKKQKPPFPLPREGNNNNDEDQKNASSKKRSTSSSSSSSSSSKNNNNNNKQPMTAMEQLQSMMDKQNQAQKLHQQRAQLAAQHQARASSSSSSSSSSSLSIVRKGGQEPPSSLAVGCVVATIIFVCLLPFFGLPYLIAARRRSYDSLTSPEIISYPVNKAAREYFSSSSASSSNSDKSSVSSSSSVSFVKQNTATIVAIRGTYTKLPYSLISSLAQAPSSLKIQVVFVLSKSATIAFERSEDLFHQQIENVLLRERNREKTSFREDEGTTTRAPPMMHALDESDSDAHKKKRKNNKNHEAKDNNEDLVIDEQLDDFDDYILLQRRKKNKNNNNNNNNNNKQASSSSPTYHKCLEKGQYRIIFSPSSSQDNSNNDDDKTNNKLASLSYLYNSGIDEISPSAGTVLLLSDSMMPANPSTFIFHLVSEFDSVRQSDGDDDDDNEDDEAEKAKRNRGAASVSAMQCSVLQHDEIQQDRRSTRVKYHHRHLKRKFLQRRIVERQERFRHLNEDHRKEKEEKIRMRMKRIRGKEQKDSSSSSFSSLSKSKVALGSLREMWHDPDVRIVDNGWKVGIAAPPGHSSESAKGVTFFNTWHGFSLRAAGFFPPLETDEDENNNKQKDDSEEEEEEEEREEKEERQEELERLAAVKEVEDGGGVGTAGGGHNNNKNKELEEEEEDEELLPILVDGLGSHCIIIDRTALHDAGAFAATASLPSDVDFVASGAGWKQASLHLSQLFAFDVTTMFLQHINRVMSTSVSHVTLAKRRTARACASSGIDAVTKLEESTGISSSVLAMRWEDQKPWRDHFQPEILEELGKCDYDRDYEIDIVICLCNLVKLSMTNLQNQIRDTPQLDIGIPDAAPGWQLSLRLRALDLTNNRVASSRSALAFFVLPDSSTSRKLYSDPSWSSVFLHHVLPPSFQLASCPHNVFDTETWVKFTRGLFPEYSRLIAAHRAQAASLDALHIHSTSSSSSSSYSNDNNNKGKKNHKKTGRVILSSSSSSNQDESKEKEKKKNKKKSSASSTLRRLEQRASSLLKKAKRRFASHHHNRGDGDDDENVVTAADWEKVPRVAWAHRNSMLALWGRRSHSSLISKWQSNSSLHFSSASMNKKPTSSALEHYFGGEDSNNNNNNVGLGEVVEWTASDLEKMPFIHIVWFAICAGCCGFSAEIAHFVRPLSELYPVNVLIGPDCFCKGYDSAFADAVGRSHLRPNKFSRVDFYPGEALIWISHTDPMSFRRPDFFHRRRPSFIIGRTMYEFTRVPQVWEKALREHSDEIWAPSQFVLQMFLDAGVSPKKLRLVPEGIDTKFFAPEIHEPLRMNRRANLRSLEFERKHGVRLQNFLCNIPFEDDDDDDENEHDGNSNNNDDEFVFFSQFKWEPRKGWRSLFEAYFRTFTKHDKVTLAVLTLSFYMEASDKIPDIHNASLPFLDIELLVKEMYGGGGGGGGSENNNNNENDSAETYHNKNKNKMNMNNKNNNSASSSSSKIPKLSDLPRFCILADAVTERQMARLFRGADAFVLPTRGEGWGLPTMQAMSMSLPVITTNWGGSVDFTTPETTFLIEIENVEEVPIHSPYGHRPGKKWCTPSIRHLGQLMRYVFSEREHAAEVGLRAREHIKMNFDDFEVVRIVDRRLQEIAYSIKNRGFFNL